MAFPKGTQSNTGLSKTFGNAVGADEQSNKGPTSSSKTIGNIKGRYTFSKSNISDLNTGEWGVNTSTKGPGKA